MPGPGWHTCPSRCPLRSLGGQSRVPGSHPHTHKHFEPFITGDTIYPCSAAGGLSIELGVDKVRFKHTEKHNSKASVDMMPGSPQPHKRIFSGTHLGKSMRHGSVR